MNNDSMPDTFIHKRGNPRQRHGQRGMGDYPEPFIEYVRPATSMPMPPGPSDFPIEQGSVTPTTNDLLQRILDELVKMNIAARPVIRAKAADSTGETLDWSVLGIMDRLVIRNEGPNSVWFSFDKNGPAVQATTSDLSWELQAQESVNLDHCLFQKIGLLCAGGGTATVHAIGFQTVAGNQAASIV